MPRLHLQQFPTGTQTVSVGSTKTFTIKSKDDSGVAPTITVMNPPSDNSSIWSTDFFNSTSGEDDNDLYDKFCTRLFNGRYYLCCAHSFH